MLGTSIDRWASHALLDAYVEAGGNFLDTAKVYADWVPGERSRSEKLLGEWMSSRGNRSRMVLATKGGHVELPDMAPRVSPKCISKDLEDSLRNLHTDVVDLYWLHRDDLEQPVSALIDTLNLQQKAGKIRAFGCSNWTAPRIRAAHAYAKSSGQNSFTANQPMWSAAIIDPEAVRSFDQTLVAMDLDAHALHRELQLACVPYSSQANGLFNKMAVESSPPHRLRRSVRALYHYLKGVRTFYPYFGNARRFAALSRIASEQQLTITQVTLAYLLSQPFPVFPIIGCSNTDQLRDSMAATTVRLSSASISTINQAR